MLYKFKSKAGADVIMLQPHGDELLRIIGRNPAARGILEVADLPAAMQALQAAARDASPATGDDADDRNAVGLRQRLWPMTELIRHSINDGVPIVWGA